MNEDAVDISRLFGFLFFIFLVGLVLIGAGVSGMANQPVKAAKKVDPSYEKAKAFFFQFEKECPKHPMNWDFAQKCRDNIKWNNKPYYCVAPCKLSKVIRIKKD